MIAGAEPIIAIDILDNKLELSKQFGATHTVNSSQVDPVMAIQDLTDGQGVIMPLKLLVLSAIRLSSQFSALANEVLPSMLVMHPLTHRLILMRVFYS